MITGREHSGGHVGRLLRLVRILVELQAAGPDRDAGQHRAEGVDAASRPVEHPRYPVGYTSFLDGPDGKAGAGDHTAVDDSREVFWVNGTRTCPTSRATRVACTRSKDPYYNSADGCAGTYKETYGGKRFRNNEWPQRIPPCIRRITSPFGPPLS